MSFTKTTIFMVLWFTLLSAKNRDTVFIQSTNAQLYTVIHYNPGAETVVLLHGGPGVPMDFTPIIEQLSAKYQVVAFDQRGTGRSPAEDATYAMEEYIDDINSVMKYIGVDKVHLFGHSWGGLFAQIYAEKYPEKILSMFLSSPSSGTGVHWKKTESEVMLFNKEHTGFWGWSMMGMRSLLGMMGCDAAYQALFKQVLENYHKEFDSTFEATDAMVENVRSEPVNQTRSHIVDYPLLKDSVDYRFPIIVSYGEKDIYGESKAHVRNRYSSATFIQIENAGHIAWKHNPEKFYNIMVSFYKLNEEYQAVGEVL